MGVAYLSFVVASFPLLFIFPDIIQLGGVVVRADYLVLPLGAVILLSRAVTPWSKGSATGYQTAALWVAVGYPLFTLFQVLWSGELGGDALKYALWPLKMAIWGLCLRELFVEHPRPLHALYNVVATLVVLIALIQVAELLSGSVRNILMDWYPMAAAGRIGDITYRARGVFNGYDTTSMFFVFAGIFLTQLQRPLGYSFSGLLLLVVLCLFGALVSARTGMLLLTLYLGIHFWKRVPSSWKALFVMGALTAGLGIVVFEPGVSAGEEGTLGGRYLELVTTLTTGDLLAVNSFWGTFAMNAIALNDSSLDLLYGGGLTAGTTADQLYVKYIVMFGLIGLGVWLVLHLGLLASLHRLPTDPGAAALRRACFLATAFILIAHVKGGNYFLAQRLGELLTLCMLLAMTSPKMLESKP